MFVFCNETTTTEIDTYGHTMSHNDVLPIGLADHPHGSLGLEELPEATADDLVVVEQEHARSHPASLPRRARWCAPAPAAPSPCVLASDADVSPIHRRPLGHAPLAAGSCTCRPPPPRRSPTSSPPRCAVAHRPSVPEDNS